MNFDAVAHVSATAVLCDSLSSGVRPALGGGAAADPIGAGDRGEQWLGRDP
jgi:hypothetical protein